MTSFKTRVYALLSFVFICALGVLLQGRPATAAPIPFLGGMLDAHFRLYDLSNFDFILRRDYVLGTDFNPGVPDSFTDPSAPKPYAASFGPGTSAALGLGSPKLFSWFTFDAAISGLDTGCVDLGSISLVDTGLIVLRGSCTFDQKWNNIENAGWDAGIVVNNVAGAIGGMAGLVSEHTIPFALVTQAVGDELRQGSDSFFSGAEHRQTLPLISLDVTWTPNAVPQPGTLALVVLGLACLGTRDRRRCGMRDPQ